MAATFFGGEIKYTKRYRLGQLLSTLTRHFLLLTRKRPARNCTFFVASGGLQAEHDAHNGTSAAAAVTFPAGKS
jgi:hypothetical protein